MKSNGKTGFTISPFHHFTISPFHHFFILKLLYFIFVLYLEINSL